MKACTQKVSFPKIYLQIPVNSYEINFSGLHRIDLNLLKLGSGWLKILHRCISNGSIYSIAGISAKERKLDAVPIFLVMALDLKSDLKRSVQLLSRM